MAKSEITIGIFGGMGPLTGYDFFKLLIEKIEEILKPKSDQEHPGILFWSDPTIPRKDHCVRILEEKGIIAPEQDARPGLQKGMKIFKQANVSFAVAPCNTFHYFRIKLQEEHGVEILDMISIVADAILKKAKNKNLPVKKVGLLATDSTVKYQIYDKEFNKRQIEIVKPNEEEQKIVQEVIELAKQGKALEQTTKDKLIKIIQSLERQGVDFIILGCTELPLVIRPDAYTGTANLISSTEELATATVHEILRRLSNVDKIDTNYSKFFVSHSPANATSVIKKLDIKDELAPEIRIRASL